MNPVFPTSYSTLCSLALASLISDKYRLENVQCQFILRGVGDTYIVESDEHRYVLRVYRSSHRSEPQIREETDLLLALKEAGVPVSYPVHDVSGTAIQILDAAEGKRCAVLFTYAPGHSVNMLNERQLYNLGNQMARFHNVSSDFLPGGQRWNFDLETTLYRPIEMLKTAFAADPEGYTWLKRSAGLAEKKLGQLNTSGFSNGYCHYDMLPKNFHFEGDAVTFFDFDFMGYGWLVNDIMTFWQHLSLDVHFGKTTQGAADKAYAIFIAGYRAFRALSKDELAAVPYLSLGFWVFYSGFHTTHDQFYLFIQPAHLKQRFGFVRQMMERYWEKED